MTTTGMRRLRLPAACLVLFTGFALGCMSFTIGGHTDVVAPDPSVGLQTGKLHVPSNETLTVYYPVPYQSPPNLVIDDGWSEWKLVSQHPDHFCVKNTSAFTREVCWTARGVKVVPPAGPPPSLAEPTVQQTQKDGS